MLDRSLASAPPFICNYLPCANAPQHLAGAAITALHGFTPLLPFEGCTFAFTSYAGTLTCALGTDADIVDSAEALAACLTRAGAAVRDNHDERA